MGMARSFRKPTLRQIEVFKAVIETGTVSRAAETLNMSQPAASKLLSNLEADIGMELFERRELAGSIQCMKESRCARRRENVPYGCYRL